MGMRQRLGIAVALLGDPELLIFDEPVNGLDPDGIMWIRKLMRSLAAEGRTVFVSSHLMSEMALTADSVIVIGQGALARRDVGRSTHSRQLTKLRAGSLRSPTRSHETVQDRGGASTRESDGALAVTGMTAAQIGDLAAAKGIALHELSPQEASLEEAYMELTRDSVEYLAGVPGSKAPVVPEFAGKVA